VKLRCGPVLPGLRSRPWFVTNNNLGGACALRSTGVDLLKHLEANMPPDGQAIETALREPRRELLRKDEPTAIGMNWIRTPDGQLKQTMNWHNGGTDGFSSFLGFTKDERAGVVILSNASGSADALGAGPLYDLAGQSLATDKRRGGIRFLLLNCALSDVQFLLLNSLA
jgi:CubicO group peptidase (beta-lactamase class C family)